MKSKSLGLLYLALLSTLIACGKNNESGRNASSWNFGNPLLNPLSSVNSPFGFNGGSVNQVMQENPCVSGFGGMSGHNQPYGNQRIPIQIPLIHFPTVIAPNDTYVGVTSYGDVAVVVGQGPGQPPLFVGYMCPRSFAPSGQGQLMGIKIGSYTRCMAKPITAATVVFPGGYATAEFRWMDGGSSLRRPFSFCQF